MTPREAGRGSVMGALVGDAAGARLEFTGKPGRSEVKDALAMLGGGCWRTAPGQITDDGEMAMCLMHALAGAASFSIERVAEMYLRWFKSLPFDMGRTTRNGISAALGRPAGQLHLAMWRASKRDNMGSKANGSLMRIAPLGAWGHRLSEEELVDAARMDSRLTHPHPTCQDCAAVYCAAIRHLVHNPMDSEGAFRTAVEWSQRLEDKEVQAWLSSAQRNEDVGYEPRSGFVKYGFVHAFRHLKCRSSYLDALFETLSGGGDTDTNAAIVGGLVGAFHGEGGIPAPLREAVLDCDTRKGRSRPEFLQTSTQLPSLLERLLE